MEKLTERITFRLIHMPCCGQLLCWVNPRLPNFCPECSTQVLGQLRVKRECIHIQDENAMLTYHLE